MTETEDIIVRTNKVTKFFDQTPVVYRLSLDIPKGGIYGLLGPNGAGKSTTIKMLTGCLKPSSGSLSIFGYDPWSERAQVMKRVGYLPERTAVLQDKTAIKYLVFLARLSGMSREAAYKKVRVILNQVGIGNMENSTISKMSAGEKQRLGLANALLADPSFLILDEPTANLDPEGRVYVLDLINDFASQGKTILISSHILPEIQRICSRIGIISQGHLLTAGRITDLVKNVYDEDYLIDTSHSNELFEELKDVSYLSNLSKDGVWIYARCDPNYFEQFWTLIPTLCSENNWKLRTFKSARDPLERVFMDLVNPQSAFAASDVRSLERSES